MQKEHCRIAKGQEIDINIKVKKEQNLMNLFSKLGKNSTEIEIPRCG